MSYTGESETTTHGKKTEKVRLINWCIVKKDGKLGEKWLVREEETGLYREIVSDIHRHLLNDCSSINEAVNKVSSSYCRPIPYHPIYILIKEDGRIHDYRPMAKDWEDLEDIPILSKIAHEIRVVTVIVMKQEQPKGEKLNEARSSLIKEALFSSRDTFERENIAQQLSALTQVKPLRLLVTEQHDGLLSKQCLSAKETLTFLRTHASKAHEKKETLTVYRLHLNKKFGRDANAVICNKILTETHSKPWWSNKGDIFMSNCFFRFTFFTNGAQPEQSPLERLFLEQYFMVPCETGAHNATSATNVENIMKHVVPEMEWEKGPVKRQEDKLTVSPAALISKSEGEASRGRSDKDKIAVLDYKMFYPYVMCMFTDSPAYKRRVLHMATARSLVPAIKDLYVKEIGMLKHNREALLFRVLALSRTILGSLTHACKQIGLTVLLTQTDSVTVHVTPTAMQTNGGSLNHIVSVLQQKVRDQHPTFLSQLKLERSGTNMIIYGPNKHILYQGENVVHRTGFHCKTFCPAMSRTLEEVTTNRSQAMQLLCSPATSTNLPMFVSNKFRQHVVDKTDLVCASYSLNPLLVHLLHVQPGEDGLFNRMPHLYWALSKYNEDNLLTKPTKEAFLTYLNLNTAAMGSNKNVEKAEQVLEKIFTENMGMIRWKQVLTELTEHYEKKTASFLKGAQFF